MRSSVWLLRCWLMYLHLRVSCFPSFKQALIEARPSFSHFVFSPHRACVQAAAFPFVPPLPAIMQGCLKAAFFPSLDLTLTCLQGLPEA